MTRLSFIISMACVFSMPLVVFIAIWVSYKIENAWQKHKAKHTVYTPLTDEEWENGIPF